MLIVEFVILVKYIYVVMIILKCQRRTYIQVEIFYIGTNMYSLSHLNMMYILAFV